MSKTLPFGWDAVFKETAHVSDDGEVVIKKTQPGEQLILDQNARMRAVNKTIRRGDQVWFHHVARIPEILWERWIREIPGLAQGAPEANAEVLARLNQRDYCHLKTYDGTI